MTMAWRQRRRTPTYLERVLEELTFDGEQVGVVISDDAGITRRIGGDERYLAKRLTGTWRHKVTRVSRGHATCHVAQRQLVDSLHIFNSQSIAMINALWKIICILKWHTLAPSVYNFT